MNIEEVRSVLQQLDELAEVWGDEGKFRRCRDRLRDAIAKSDAEAAERALPITEEWLRVVMPDRRRSDERIWHSLHIKNDLYETHLLVRHVELSRFWAVLVQALEHDETLTEKVAFGDLKNRGQLLDLLAALKGGEV